MVYISFYNFFILLEGNNFKFSLAFIDNEQNEARVEADQNLFYILYICILYLFFYLF